MKLCQPKSIGPIDDHGVGVGDINAIFYDIGGHKNVELPTVEIRHDFLQLSRFHLTVSHTDMSRRYFILDFRRHLLYILHTVVDKEHLPVTGQFAGNGSLDNLRIVHMNLRIDGLAVLRRRLNNAQVPDTHE